MAVKRGPLLFGAALLALGAAVAHAVGAPHQIPAVALLLWLAALVQAGAAVAAVARPTPPVLAAAAAVGAAGVAAWLAARTLPSLRPETLGLMDLFLPAMEAASAVCFLGVLGRARGCRALSALPAASGIAVVVAALVKEPLAIVVLVVLFFSAAVPQSLLDVFVPAAMALAAVLVLRARWPRLRQALPGRGRDVAKLVAVLFAVTLLTWASAATAADRLWLPLAAAVRARAGQTTTLSYCAPGGDPLAMDVTEPPAGAARPAPAVFYIHGGEGILGDRVLGGSEGPYLARLRDDLSARGFVVGSIDYRLAPVFPFTSQVEDAACAAAFLRAHAAELGIDPARIGVYGDSEGGYLAAMLGTAAPGSAGRVAAVVDMWGPTDLSDFSGSPSWVSLLVAGMVGGRASAAHARTISPLYLAGPGDPPFLIIHGTADWFVAPRHSQRLAQRLQSAGVPVTLLMVQNGGHGLNAAPSGTVQRPSAGALVQTIRDFLTSRLGA